MPHLRASFRLEAHPSHRRGGSQAGALGGKKFCKRAEIAKMNKQALKVVASRASVTSVLTVVSLLVMISAPICSVVARVVSCAISISATFGPTSLVTTIVL
mmetsp:Transcript_33628/g.78782  ORF Transcript_33628/g.78782 Transcript_33628/m.78782 type:complete len:101 (+) Transcript_33628:411-713(+)